MSLLDIGGGQTVTVFHQEEFLSPQGNLMFRPSTTDVDVIAYCAVQTSAQSGTSQRRAEQDNEGYETEESYRFRPPRTYTRIIKSGSEVEWNGKRYAIVGEPRRYSSSTRTAHVDYTLRRA